MPKFQALIELKKESSFATPGSDVAGEYEKLLNGIKEDCRTRDIFFKKSLATPAKGVDKFEAHVVGIFTSAFPKTKINDHILTVAEGALTVFISALLKHKAIEHKIAFYAHEHLEPHNKSNQKELEDELLEFVKKDAKVFTSSVQEKYKELYLKKIQSLETAKKLKKLEKLRKTGKLSKEESRKSEQEIAKSLPSIESGLKKLIQENEDVVKNMDEVIDLFPDVDAGLEKLGKDPDGLIAKALRQKLKEYEALKEQLLLEAKLKEKQEQEQKEWLIQYRKDLVTNLTQTLNSVFKGDAGMATEIVYSVAGGKVIEGQLSDFLTKVSIWEAYEPAAKAAIKTKLEGLTITAPKKFNEDGNDTSFKEDLSTGTDLQSTFKSNLEGKTLDTASVRNKLTLVSVGGGKLESKLVNEHVKDVEWSEVNLSGTAKLHNNLDAELKALIKEVGNIKFPISNVVAKAKESRYQVYRLLVEDYVTPLVLWGMDDSGEGTIDATWLDEWEEHFNENPTFVNLQNKFKKLNSTQQAEKLETYTDDVLTLIGYEYGVDYEVSPAMAETLCRKWFIVSGSKLSAFQKAEYAQKVTEAISELAGLSVTFGSLGSAIKDVKKNSGQWNDWKDLFDKTDQAWNGFKKASDTVGLAAQAVGVAVDVGVAYKETKSYKESKGDREWKESWKKKLVIGSIIISIGEIKNTTKDITEYKDLEIKYFGETNDKVKYNKGYVSIENFGKVI
ncbi:MAG: coiled-coil domain-containing protein 22 [Aureispira sp.]|nr:coiled-coil domain-containing protein 22 [Aureispira sp.]